MRLAESNPVVRIASDNQPPRAMAGGKGQERSKVPTLMALYNIKHYSIVGVRDLQTATHDQRSIPSGLDEWVLM